MRSLSRGRAARLLVLALAPAVLADATARGETAPDATAEAARPVRTLDRPADRVSVFGEEIPSLVGQRPDHYGVLAWRDGALAPIPCQIDERNPYGFLVLDAGPFAEADTDGGRFDDNDEILFFASDTGDRAPEGAAAAYPDVAGWVEVAVREPATGNTGWAYLVQTAGPAPRSPRDDVSYDPVRDRVTTSVYTIGFPKDDDGNARNYPDEFAISPAAGGSGEDILDRLKVRTDAEVLFGIVSFSRSEEDFRTRVLAWRDGPVRVVRRAETALHILFGIYAPPIAVDSLYYRDFVENPNVLDMPIRVGSFLSKLDLRASFDFTKQAYGMRLVSPDNRDVPPFDGERTGAEKTLVTRNQTWHLVTGPQGTIMTRMIVGPTLPLTQVLRYEDDADADDGPESEDGVHELGRTLEGGLEIGKGRHGFNAFLYVPSHWQPGREQPYLAMLDDPLDVRLSGPGTRPRRGSARAEDEAEGAGGGDWRALLAEVQAAVRAVPAYTAKLALYSSAYRGRQLEGRRLCTAKFHQEPRWSWWRIDESDTNYDDPINAGVESAYYADEDRVLGRGTGVRRLFGTVEMKPADAPAWWWGEAITTLDWWTLADAWSTFADPGYGFRGEATIDGRRVEQLTLVTTRKPKGSLRDPLGTAAVNVEIRKLRISVDPATKLPLKVESFIPGNASPVAWVEFRDVDLEAQLDRDDFDLSGL